MCTAKTIEVAHFVTIVSTQVSPPQTITHKSTV